MTDTQTISPVRALIVDDEPLARAHLKSLLRERGDVDIIGESGDGRSAIDQIRRLTPDLVLLDIQMPELGGLEVIREIGPTKMPAVVFVTAYDEHALAAFEVHAFDYILKPVSRQRFTQAIDRVIGLICSDRSDGSGAAPTDEPLTRYRRTVLPMKVFSYMAAGRPILAPALPDLEEVLTHDQTAVLVPPDDAGLAARALRDLLGDPARAGRLAAAALDASREFTWEARARKISSALQTWLA